jgi:hypothetical protein
MNPEFPILDAPLSAFGVKGGRFRILRPLTWHLHLSSRKVLEFPPTSRYKLCVKRERASSRIFITFQGKEGMEHEG